LNTPGLDVRSFTNISCDSRKVERGGLFVAIKGARADGHDYIIDAIKKGASLIIAEDASKVPAGTGHIIVEDSRVFLSQAADIFYGRPSQRLKVLGITGTNGKTTTSYLAEAILRDAGYRVGRIGTIEYKIGDKSFESVNTTPGPLELQGLLSEMEKGGAEYVVMEVSSHALDQHRVDGVRFSSALFTNLTQDHLDYHKDMENYLAAKSRLFDIMPSENTACLNIDDPYVARLSKGMKRKAIRYSVKGESDLFVDGRCDISVVGTDFYVSYKGERTEIHTPLIGMHNVYNVLGALALGISRGFSVGSMTGAVSSLKNVPGRLEKIASRAPFDIFIDYAHTPDALVNALTVLRGICRSRLICVFGCGGERDKSKRPLMGRAASEICDILIATSDNPRSEDPAVIAEEVVSGFDEDFSGYEVILDRREAIAKAVGSALPGDVVAICGKGHEAYQIIGSDKLPFDDREVTKAVLKEAGICAL